jgi:hypothetical protein
MMQYGIPPVIYHMIVCSHELFEDVELTPDHNAIDIQPHEIDDSYIMFVLIH